MSITLFSEVYQMSIGSPTDKAVLLALADAANDQLDGMTWIPISSRDREKGVKGRKLDLITKTELSERAIRNALRRLEEAGHISRKEDPGKGVYYWVHPVSSLEMETPAPRASRHEMPPAPKTETPAPRAADPGTTCPQTLNNPNNPYPAREAGDEYWRLPLERKAAEAASRKAKLKRQEPPPALPASAARSDPKLRVPVAAKAREDERSLTMHAALKASIGEEAWRDCFACAAMVFDEPGATVIIADPCRRQMLEERFGNALLGAARRAFGPNVRWVRVRVETNGALAL
ncbi:hypothetical protein [Erythrobacter sp. HL-111]|uniref:hypothetical protein n=1 Tax=Erythrobacter sp. HL-111 TaxID=1798193 RepID=UPI0006DB270B|nr:hypothetical protein [Erythrobacter sp. HL-111]KPP87572.1 MAG: PaaX-like protein [Erythrobacteraceae bacterium HL-111]SDR79880.1 hypothetical protein SAMN04515621_0392 [Erythrobacter sp. HL-111]